ncbi:hypothetical protein ACFOLJ_12135 [Rugamonas sp. CCM 8940]|uniref:hypothetical protein n=1 Tax=Rugamonas sp. CCM 8940 TaxID=2765359 RepID=UPI0018F7AC22|nr:hypothetical protein [Rugamonas sp. CCM 8940]MBJ7311511.1 hypothetical protein [Rugamonas sp. CCM 8940]
MTVDAYYPHAVLAWLETNRSRLSAQRSAQLWRAITDELAPIIGKEGFAILYVRCLHLNSTAFPWMAAGPGMALESGNFEALAGSLADRLAGRPAAEAVAGSAALFRIFYDLLLVLVGEQLTAGVLDASWRDQPYRNVEPMALQSVPCQSR